jgi:hypothetical protein
MAVKSGKVLLAQLLRRELTGGSGNHPRDLQWPAEGSTDDAET